MTIASSKSRLEMEFEAESIESRERGGANKTDSGKVTLGKKRWVGRSRPYAVDKLLYGERLV